jgi:hypothetical protein
MRMDIRIAGAAKTASGKDHRAMRFGCEAHRVQVCRLQAIAFDEVPAAGRETIRVLAD